MEDKTLNEMILDVLNSFYTTKTMSNEIEKLIFYEIEKAFDAGYNRACWEEMGTSKENEEPDKEEYIKSIKKEPQ